MTERKQEPPYAEGEAFEDPRSGNTWEVVTVERTYVLEIQERNGNGDIVATEPARYPEGIIREKLERGDLSVPEPDMIPCEYCDYQAETEHGIKTHEGKAHPDKTDSDELTEE